MKKRSLIAMIATVLLSAALLTLFTGRITGRLAAADTLQVGTLVPKASPWGKVLETWALAVKEKSGGRLEVQLFYNGSLGDEGAMIAKLKAGQVDGALVSAVGLSKVYKPILALQLPGLFSSWAKLDAARTALKGDFEKGARDAGFAIVGWTDVGAVHRMSKGLAIRVPDDLKGKKPFMWRDDAIDPSFFQAVGGVSPVPLNIPEVLPQLNTGGINIVSAGSLYAEQLQWAGKLDTIDAEVSGYAIGGLVLAQKRLDALPDDLRAIVLDTGRVAAAALTKRIRDEDAAAFARLKGKMTVLTLTADEKAAWTALYQQVRKRTTPGTFSTDLVKQLEALAK